MEKQMIEKEYKIKPCLVESKKMYDLYNKLLDIGYSIKIFEKKKDSDIYKYFLPKIREYMLWTFNLKNKEKFLKMQNEMKAAVCNNYECTIFEKEEVQIICFSTGIIFIIGNEVEKQVLDYKYMQNIEEINIPSDKIYKIKVEKIEQLYTYIISLYKFVILRKLDNRMENKNLFDINRSVFIEFVQDIYSTKITDNINGNKYMNDVEQKLELDKLYISVENKFDLLYRNNKLDNHTNINTIIIILLVVLIIMSVINIGNWF